MKFFVLAASVLIGCLSSDSDDSNSLLQLQAQKVTKESASTALWHKTILMANASSARCGCRMVGCSTSMCACEQILCECHCEHRVEVCPACCDGDKACIKSKIKKLAKSEIKKLDNLDKYKIALAKYERNVLKHSRANEDSRWKHAKAMRDHQLQVREVEDADWKEQKESHKELKELAKQRKQDYKEWSSDLKEVLDGVVHEMDGGMILEHAEIVLPMCDCPPPMMCPPVEECGECMNTCPPCHPCEREPTDCDACAEDEPVLDSVRRWLGDHEWFIVPTPHEDDDLVPIDDSPPVDVEPISLD